MDDLNDTPETDAEHRAIIEGGSDFSFPAHARKMERQRDSARRRAELLRAELERLSSVVCEDDAEIILSVLSNDNVIKRTS